MKLTTKTMKNRNTNRKPKTHDEIEDAISSFLKHGGKIKQLEAQQNETLNLDSIGSEDWKIVCKITGIDKSTRMLN